MSEIDKPDLTALTVQLLSAYVGNNAVPSGELAELIRSTRSALSEGETPAAPPEPEYVAAVSARASTASREHILSMIDGKPYKSLKRHLSTHGLTPAEYRSRYNLPRDYPMVAPSYSEQRREVAKRLGLGRKPAQAESVAETSQSETVPDSPAKQQARSRPAAKAPRAKSAKGTRTAKARPAQPAQD